MKKRKPGPSPRMVRATINAVCDIGGACVAISSPVLKGLVKRADELAEEFADIEKRVRGNRADDVPITWDDLRLMLIGHLRILLRKLDEPTDGQGT